MPFWRRPAAARGWSTPGCRRRRGRWRRPAARRCRRPRGRRAPPRPRGSWRTPALVPAGQDVVEGDEAELAGVGRGAGDDDPRGLEQRLEPADHRSRSGHLDQGVDGHRPAVDDDQRVEVGADDRRDRLGRRQRPTARRPWPPGRRPARPAPRRAPGSARSSIISAASSRVIGTSRKATSATASASTPPTPSITVMPNCASWWRPAISSVARDHRGHRAGDLAVLGPGGGEQLGRRRPRTASSSASPSRTRPRSVLWAMASPQSLATTG